MHHVVDQLDQLRRHPTLDDVSATVDGLVNDPHVPANLRYYVDRMSRYYTDGQRALALLALDMIAQQPAPVSVPDLLKSVQAPRTVIGRRTVPRRPGAPGRSAGRLDVVVSSLQAQEFEDLALRRSQLTHDRSP